MDNKIIIKRDIYNIFDDVRKVFNDFYSNKEGEYSSSEKKILRGFVIDMKLKLDDLYQNCDYKLNESEECE